jgi:2',3'-cyclic-nucleotide 2'-phosphodiesterase / 3'-nucleotidase / 5'-nucleotidase
VHLLSQAGAVAANRTCIACLLGILCALTPATGTAQTASDTTARVRVLAVHDLHGALRESTPPWSGGRAVGGAAALKAHMDSAAARCACPTVRLDGGDQLQGSLESNLAFGEAAVHALNLLGLDAAAIGNHELDWGVATFVARQRQATYAWLAANVFYRDSERRPDWAPPFAIVERGGLRIGVIGYALSSTPATLRRTTTEPYEFRRGLTGVADALRTVRALRPDFTVIVAHAGGDCSRGACRGEMVELAQALDSAGVDLIVGGHTHESGDGVVNGIPIVRAGSHGRAVAVVDLVRLRDGSRTFELAVDTTFHDRVTPDNAMALSLAPWFEQADAFANSPLATFADRLSRQTPGLGHLMTDALRAAAGADVALYNGGGLRATVGPGTATYSDLFRVLPFGNGVVRITVTGQQLRAILEHAVAGGDFISGAVVRYDSAAPPGARIADIRLGDGVPLDDQRTYILGVPDFFADGGREYTTLMTLPQERLELTMLDGAITYLAALPQPIVAPAEPRVIATPQRR